MEQVEIRTRAAHRSIRRPEPAPGSDAVRGRFGLWLPLALALIGSSGVLGAGWFVSRLPKSFAASTTFERRFGSPEALEQQLRGASGVAEEITDHALVRSALVDVPEMAAEIGTSTMDVRSRVRVAVDSLGVDRERVTVRVEATTAKGAGDFAVALVQRYLRRENRLDEKAHLRFRQEEAAQGLRLAQRAHAEAVRALDQARQSSAGQELQRIEQSLKEIRVALAGAERERNKLRAQVGDRPRELALAPPLEHPVRTEDDSLVQASLKRFVQERAELAALFTDQHPGVVHLDRKIHDLAQQCGVTDLQGLLEGKQVAMESPSELRARHALDRAEARLTELQAKEAELVRAESLRKPDARTLEEAKRLVAEQGRKLSEAEGEKSAADLAVHQFDLSRAVTLQATKESPLIYYIGPDRKVWFATASGCWLFGVVAIGLVLQARKAS